MKNRTFSIIKPNVMASGNTGKILDAILSEGYVVRAMKMVFMSRNDAARFYAIHSRKPFFEDLLAFMTSGPAIVMILEKENAVASFRALVGNTNPAEAGEGTLRRRFGEDLDRNAIHAADSDENAVAEWSQFFAPEEIVDYDYTGKKW